VHEQPWRCSSASSAPNLSVAADFHDHHLDAGKHDELRKEGDDGGGDGMGDGGGRASTAGGRVSDSCSGGAAGSMEAPNMAPMCNGPDAPRSAVPGMLRI
jgi:hypothetical protein